MFIFFFSSRRRHTRSLCDWSSDVCSSDLIDARHRFLEHRVHVDVLYHGFVDPCSGMMMSTWAPGNAGRPSFKGTSSSHLGTIAMRAVPLRIAILPRSEERRVGKEGRSRSPPHRVESNTRWSTCQ